MKKAHSLAQFFACFTYLGDYIDNGGYEKCYDHALEMISFIEKQLCIYSKDIAIAKSCREIRKNEQDHKVSAIITIEEGGILNGKIDRLHTLYERGVRLMTLMWNYENCLGYPNSKEIQVMQKGLKPFGIEVVKQMGELGMIVDVSHASDGSFWDVMRYAKGPVVASHSNCRALCNHQRNLSDEMIRSLAEKGGVAGLNFYPYFVNENGKAGVDDLVHHLEHMYYVGGEDFVAVGTDFDGFDQGELELRNIGEMNCLYEALKKRKFNDGQIEKFWHGNVMRVMKEVL